MKSINANVAAKICTFKPLSIGLGFMFIVIAVERKALQ